jgi:hypothetical protein
LASSTARSGRGRSGVRIFPVIVVTGTSGAAEAPLAVPLSGRAGFACATV